MSFSTYYDSADTGLGGVANTAGSLLSFLDKVLVNGYNSKTLTSMTQVGTLVTATLTAHGYRDLQFVTISGVTPSGYNGTWQIVSGSTTANTFQFNTSTSGMGSATGTIGCIVAPLGWATAFTGTNLRAYQAPTGNRLYLRLDDTGTTTAKAVGYESMSDINTGINIFPLVLQLSGGVFWSKSNSASAVRTILWGNGVIFYLFNDYTNNSSSGTFSSFGDIIPFKTGDAWATRLLGQSAAGTFEGTLSPAISNASGNFTNSGDHFLARSYLQLPGGVLATQVSETRFASSFVGSGTWQFGGATSVSTYPMPVDGNMWVAPIYVLETVGAVRGIAPGFWAPVHTRPINTYTIFPGAGSLAGKTLMIIWTATTGCIIAEISNTF